MNFRKKYETAIIFFLISVFGLLITSKINLVTADLGRHLKNGEIILKTFSVPKTNLYSYTNPLYSFVNHHWGSGVIFYLIQQTLGFAGLSIFFTVVSLMTFLLFFRVALKKSSFIVVATTSLFVIPVLASRNEIRPEIFSYLFCGIFLLILTAIKEKEASERWLFLLPFLEIFWINLHIYFWLGFFLLGVFFLGELLKARGWKRMACLGGVFLAMLGTAMLNPAGLKGFLYPFKIFGNYGYRLFENQSVWFLDKIVAYPPNLYFKIIFGVLVLSWIYVLVKRRNFSLGLVLFSVFFSYLAWTAVRNFTLFGYFALIVIAANFGQEKKTEVKTGVEFLAIFSLLSLILFCLFMINSSYWLGKIRLGIGLKEKNVQAANFFREQNLKGPIFNNYDNGGYLIYFLYPQERVFVDNRPEAYPKDFFEKIYVPMQENEENWGKMEKEYGFNTIFFYRHDLTPWAQNFLLNRVSDPTWAPVFVDDYSIIFVKRNELNQEVIKNFELPKEMFFVFR